MKQIETTKAFRKRCQEVIRKMGHNPSPRGFRNRLGVNATTLTNGKNSPELKEKYQIFLEYQGHLLELIELAILKKGNANTMFEILKTYEQEYRQANQQTQSPVTIVLETSETNKLPKPLKAKVDNG